jgi:Ca2+-transporting ATPase
MQDQAGLSSEEALRRQTKFGRNVLPEKTPPGVILLFMRQLKSPMVYILLIAAIVMVAVGRYSDSVIILLAVILSTVLGFLQEGRASKALLALRRYVTSRASVIRDGKRRTIEVGELVPGDIVLLNQGAKIPADGSLLSANRLYVDEAIITGESMPTEKSAGDAIYMGATISAGQAVMRVDTTGSATRVGTIASTIQEKEEDTPFQTQLKWFSKQLAVIVAILTAIILVVGLIYGLALKEIFITSVALAVSAIPEGLPVSLTVVLAIGMQRTLKRRGLVKKLASAETLGGVTVICVDKTGTLTLGDMKVVECLGDKTEIAKQIVIANDLDDPLLTAGFEWGRDLLADQEPIPERLDSIPFSSRERRFLCLSKWSVSANMLFVNGAPELLLEQSTLSAGEKAAVHEDIVSLTRTGHRLIGFARREVKISRTRVTPEDAKRDLTWMGLLAFSDPVRPGVTEALADAKSAGIKTVVITGDHQKTAEFVLAELGIKLAPDEIMSGHELNTLDPNELKRRIGRVRLFARTTPEDKLLIVKLLKERDEVVAMMGDGVNDAPALHQADIGLVVADASDVAKESADVILLDSNFATIIATVREGRAMFDNIRKIILYQLTDAFAEIILVLGGILLGLPLPVTAVQILWINLVSDGLPDMALTIDPPRSDIMRERPRSPKERLVTKWMGALIGLVSVIAGLLALLWFVIINASTGDVALARSVAFITLGVDSLICVFSIRTLMVPFWRARFFANKWLFLAVASGFLLLTIPFSTSALRDFFGLEVVGWQYWLLALGSGLLMFVIVEIFKWLYRGAAQHRKQKTAP